MITVYGEGRGFRVVWLLEEMGIAYASRASIRIKPLDRCAQNECRLSRFRNEDVPRKRPQLRQKLELLEGALSVRTGFDSVWRRFSVRGL